MSDGHPWKLIAPWYRWQRQQAELGLAPRQTRPVLQKYETADLVNVFLKDPQLSLRFTDEDFVHRLREIDPVPRIPSGPLAGRLKRLTTSYLEKTETRKLFLPAHKRFYLVVCELHCDQPGLPTVNRDKVCEAGFVVRRRLVSYPAEAETAALGLLQEVKSLSAQLAQLQQKAAGKKVLKKRRTRVGAVVGSVQAALTQASAQVAQQVDASVSEKKAELVGQLAGARAKLLAWSAMAGVKWLYEGWVPDAGGFENLGAWQPVSDAPQEITETVFPLYPLIPDPRAAHDAAGRTIYFGLIPTGGSEVNATGRARFDDHSRYVIRCFVRRHRPGCPKTPERNDCSGELVWSPPSELFQLASHFDPVGTGNRPVTIQLPDIPALAASEPTTPVAMSAPAGSALNFRVHDGEPTDPSIGGVPQICFFSIPLITIIATFVLNLFLPIVVFLFNLWFLLGLKFCIPPSLSISAGLQAELDAELELALSLGIDVDVNVELNTVLGVRANALFTGAKGVNVDGSLRVGTPGHGLATTYGNETLMNLEARVATDRTAEVEAGSLSAGLEYEPRVEARVGVA